MNENHEVARYRTNWSVRFLCDCKKHEQGISIHKGVAHEISEQRIHLLSDHHICHEKRVAMQLIIPAGAHNIPHKTIKIIGNSIATSAKDGQFLTEIEFAHFDQDGRQELERTLRQHFPQQFFMPLAQRAQA